AEMSTKRHVDMTTSRPGPFTRAPDTGTRPLQSLHQRGGEAVGRLGRGRWGPVVLGAPAKMSWKREHEAEDRRGGEYLRGAVVRGRVAPQAHRKGRAHRFGR